LAHESVWHGAQHGVEHGKLNGALDGAPDVCPDSEPQFMLLEIDLSVARLVVDQCQTRQNMQRNS